MPRLQCVCSAFLLPFFEPKRWVFLLVAEVAVPVPIARTFYYSVPDALASRIERGMRCSCPFHRRTVVAVVLRVSSDPVAGDIELRAIGGLLDDSPCISEELLSFLELLADYYLAPIGEVIRAAIPPVERKHAEKRKRLQQAQQAGLDYAVRRGILVVHAASETTDDVKLRGIAPAVLAHLRANGPCAVARLADVFPSARSVVKRLQEAGLVHLERVQQPAGQQRAVHVDPDVPPHPTPDQHRAMNAIARAINEQRPQAFLLQGVTGSGKTEVYMRAIEACLSNQKGALVLVPEIALTPQLVARFRARFGDAIAVVHSAMTDSARYHTWHALRQHELHVAIGARSAIFAPVNHLGLLIVDEEHDPSFKQEQGVRYHARDMALLRAQRAGAVCVLGSATPSLETQSLVRKGKVSRLVLPTRATSAPLPTVELIDLRRTGEMPRAPGVLSHVKNADVYTEANEETSATLVTIMPSQSLPSAQISEQTQVLSEHRTPVVLSLPLQRAIEQTLQNKEQVIVFLNRRGFAPSVQCSNCGQIVECPTCSVATTLHVGGGYRMQCHYCDYQSSVPRACSKCASPHLAQLGVGTESLEKILANAFPTARIVRLDRDVAPGVQSEVVIEKMRSQKADILVGTQMVTKGHDLPNVTLVAVINADAELSMPDFRASERAFQRLVQVAGRSGRASKPGRVLVQTRVPEHPVMQFALQHDVAGFVEKELQNRQEAGYPPFQRLALVRFECPDLLRLQQQAEHIAQLAKAYARSNHVQVLGPSPAPIERIRGKYRYRLLLRSHHRPALRAVVKRIAHACERADRLVHVTIDIDPIHML